MRIIGVTGGIGAGKSSVASILKEQGAFIIDADQIAKDLVKKGNSAYDEIVAFFGKDILCDDGEIDRRNLGSVVFNDKSKIGMLNYITHNQVYKKISEELNLLEKRDYRGIAVLDVPLPNEEFKKMTQEIWVVDCDDETRIQRITDRSHISREEAIKRISSQMSRENYLRLADKVINNRGSLAKLKNSVLSLIKE